MRGPDLDSSTAGQLSGTTSAGSDADDPSLARVKYGFPLSRKRKEHDSAKKGSHQKVHREGPPGNRRGGINRNAAGGVDVEEDRTATGPPHGGGGTTTATTQQHDLQSGHHAPHTHPPPLHDHGHAPRMHPHAAEDGYSHHVEGGDIHAGDYADEATRRSETDWRDREAKRAAVARAERSVATHGGTSASAQSPTSGTDRDESGREMHSSTTSRSGAHPNAWSPGGLARHAGNSPSAAGLVSPNSPSAASGGRSGSRSPKRRRGPRPPSGGKRFREDDKPVDGVGQSFQEIAASSSTTWKLDDPSSPRPRKGGRGLLGSSINPATTSGSASISEEQRGPDGRPAGTTVRSSAGFSSYEDGPKMHERGYPKHEQLPAPHGHGVPADWSDSAGARTRGPFGKTGEGCYVVVCSKS